MISWTNAKTEKPSINKKDKFDEEHKISKRVLVWFIPKNGKDKTPMVAFGRFYRELEDWVVEGFRGDVIVEHFSEINDPNEGDESLALIILNKDHDN